MFGKSASFRGWAWPGEHGLGNGGLVGLVGLRPFMKKGMPFHSIGDVAVSQVLVRRSASRRPVMLPFGLTAGSSPLPGEVAADRAARVGSARHAWHAASLRGQSGRAQGWIGGRHWGSWSSYLPKYRDPCSERSVHARPDRGVLDPGRLYCSALRTR